MAWLDDKIWCNPKIVDLSNAAFTAFVKGIAYSSGFQTAGHLSAAQQRLVGGDSKVRSELVNAGLWHVNGDGGSVDINDWDNHNGAQDARRIRERERMREYRRRLRDDAQ